MKKDYARLAANMTESQLAQYVYYENAGRKMIVAGFFGILAGYAVLKINNSNWR